MKPSANGTRSPGRAGHALDGELAAVGLADDDDRAASRPAGDRRVDEEPVAGLDGRPHAGLRDGDPPRTAEALAQAGGAPRTVDLGVPPGRAARRAPGYFLVDQKISPNSLTAASSWAAASASTLCLFLPASLSSFQTLSWRSGCASRCSGLK